MDEFESLLRQTIPGLAEDIYAKLAVHARMLLEWNERMNLTRITQPSAMARDHYLDALSARPYIPQNNRVLDVGTGAGFPGLALAIARPDLVMTLNDAQQKRLGFLQAVIDALQLSNVTLLHARAEELGQDKKIRESFDTVCARAVAPMRILAEYLLPLTRVGGQVLAFKGAQWHSELQDARRALERLGAGTARPVTPPHAPDGWAHTLLLIPKTRSTPSGYPRPNAQIIKSPL